MFVFLFKVCQSTPWRESGCDEKHGCYETKEVTVLLGSEKNPKNMYKQVDKCMRALHVSPERFSIERVHKYKLEIPSSIKIWSTVFKTAGMITVVQFHLA